MNCSILIVDDHELTQAGLRLLIEAQPNFNVLDVLGTGDEVKQCLLRHSPDIVLLDLQLPDMSGVDLLARLVGFHDMTVVILSGSEDGQSYRSALSMGARAAVSKADPSVVLVEALEHAIRGETFISQTVQGYLSNLSEADIQLPPRQMAILHFMVQGESNKEIAFRLGIALPTVSFHITELRKRLGVESNRKIVPFALKSGLI